MYRLNKHIYIYIYIYTYTHTYIIVFGAAVRSARSTASSTRSGKPATSTWSSFVIYCLSH